MADSTACADVNSGAEASPVNTTARHAELSHLKLDLELT
jgi:hypothetical protein